MQLFKIKNVVTTIKQGLKFRNHTEWSYYHKSCDIKNKFEIFPDPLAPNYYIGDTMMRKKSIRLSHDQRQLILLTYQFLNMV